MFLVALTVVRMKFETLLKLKRVAEGIGVIADRMAVSEWRGDGEFLNGNIGMLQATEMAVCAWCIEADECPAINVYKRLMNN